MVKLKTVRIQIDEDGNGLADVKFSGLLLAIGLPDSIVDRMVVSVYPTSLPKLAIKLPKSDFPETLVKVPIKDEKGKLTNELGEMPVPGSLTIGLEGGVPNTEVEVKVVYAGD